MVKIRIIKQDQWGVFKVGEVGEMNIEGARRYVDSGHAEYVDTPTITKTNKEEIRKHREKQLADKPNLKNTFQQLQFEILQLIIDKKKEQATEKIVRFIKEQTPIKATRNDDKNEIWVYKDGIFVPEGKTYIQETTRKILGQAYTTQIVNTIIAKIEADSFIDAETFFNEQNKYPELIAIKNGILNIKTRQIKPHSSNIPFFNKLNITYDPNKKPIKFIKFLDEILDSEDNKKCIQELFGYCLYKKEKHKKAFMFEGGGDNGKTQLLKILTEHFVGLENSKELSLMQIEKDQYLVSELQNKLVNVSADITQKVMENTGIFKNLTGGDPISCQRKFKNSLTIVNYAKMIFATNELPIPNDNSSGFWGRWVLIQFPFKFLKQEEINQIPQEERENIKIAKPDIIETIIDKDELSGILNWALDGFERLEKQNGFTYSETRTSVKDIWMRKAESFRAFCEDCVEEDSFDGFIEKEELRQHYLKYCKALNLKKLQTDAEIKKILEEKYSAIGKQMVIDNTLMDENNPKRKIRAWVGISINFTRLTNFTRGFDSKAVFVKNQVEVETYGKGGKGGNNNNKNSLSEGSFSSNSLNEKIINFIGKGEKRILEIIEHYEHLENVEKEINNMLLIGDLTQTKTGFVRCL